MPPGDRAPGTWRLRHWKIGTLGGFLLYLDWTWAFWVLLGLFRENGWRLLALGCIGVLIHAFAQAAASRALGLGTGSITFTLLGGFLQPKDLEPLPFEMEPSRRRRFAAMILAGPLSNLLLFAGVKLITGFGPAPEILQDFGTVNLYIGLVRLIPLYSLDGGRLILSWGHSSASRQRLHIPLAIVLVLAPLIFELPEPLGLVVFIFGIHVILFSLKTDAEIEKYVYPSESSRGTACPGCGDHLPPVSGPTDQYETASPACWARYVELMAALENHGGGAFGELSTDAYAVQHPGGETQNLYRSVAIHLLVLYGVLERGVSPEQASWIRARAARRGSSYYRLAPPSFRATPKVSSLLEAPESERPARIEQYVRSVWTAWATEYRRLLGKWYDQEVLPEF